MTPTLRLALLTATLLTGLFAGTSALAQKPSGDLEAKPSAFRGGGATFSGRGSTAPSAGRRRSGGTLELSEVDEQPVLLNRAEAARQIARNYPRELRRAGVTGTVVLKFVILPDGTVDPLSVGIETATNAGFVEPAAQVVRTMRFQPALLDGNPVRVWVTLPVFFQLETPARPPRASSLPPQA